MGKLLILSTGFLLIHGRPQMTGFNPGTDSEKTGSGSGYNAGSGGDQGSDYDESAIHYPDESQGDSGYNAGNSGSGFDPHIPDFVPDESITNPGGMGASGFNPGIDKNAPLKPSNRPDSNIGVQTLPSPIVFNEDYVPGSNKQQYVREGPLVTVGDAQTLPSPITGVRAPYVPGGNKQQYLRSGAQSSAYPGVSARPSFPPGYYPSLGLGRMVQGESQVAYESQQGPKNVLYFF